MAANHQRNKKDANKSIIEWYNISIIKSIMGNDLGHNGIA